MTLRSVFKLSEKFVIDNAPTLLSGIAVAGTATVAYLTGKATFKAAAILAEESHGLTLQELRENDQITTKDAIKLTWKCYIPPAVAVAGTVGCIVMANTISASRLAGMAAAYKLSEKHYGEYKDKVKEMLGEKTDEKVTDAVHTDAVMKHPVPSQFDDYEFAAPGIKQLCFDLHSGRYFYSDMQSIRSIENDINRQLMDDTYVRLSDFYGRFGDQLPNTKDSGEIGWTLGHPMDLKFSSQIADGAGGRTVLVVDFARRPTSLRDWNRFPECENRFGMDD